MSLWGIFSCSRYRCLYRIFSPVQSIGVFLAYLCLSSTVSRVIGICVFPEFFLLFKVSVSLWNIFSCSTYRCISGIFSPVQSICVFPEYFFCSKYRCLYQNIENGQTAARLWEPLHWSPSLIGGIFSTKYFVAMQYLSSVIVLGL